MSEVEYRALWGGADVEQFLEYVGRLDALLLVDDTMSVEDTAVCNANLHLAVRPDGYGCTTAISHPVHPETGTRLTRWVEFIQLNRYLNHRVQDVDALLPDDEVGLTPTEGLHLPGQFAEFLREYAVDLCGARCGLGGAPCVGWFGSAQPILSACDVGTRHLRYGSASRGIRVIPVSW